MNRVKFCFVVLALFAFPSLQAQEVPVHQVSSHQVHVPTRLQIVWQQAVQYVENYYIQTRKDYEERLEQRTRELHELRSPYYQWRVYQVAKSFEGINFYHDYLISGKNDESNTCVNAWCHVVAGTGIAGLTQLTEHKVNLSSQTRAEDQKWGKENQIQRKSKYISVKALISNLRRFGFLPIDLDLAQRGDVCVQYYEQKRLKYSFGPQHVSVIDMVVPWGNGTYELRDWHEGIPKHPFVYRTGTNLPSSHNNIYRPENIYHGYDNDHGQPRPLYNTKNPNICQAYGFFGQNIEQAESIIKEINFLRGELKWFGERFAKQANNQLQN